jgi:putative transposase
MVDIVFQRNCVYQTAYHVVWCPKYRKPILTGSVSVALATMIEKICVTRGWKVISKEIQPDHIHLFLSFPPSESIAGAVKILKGSTARKLFTVFPELKNQLWGGHLWSPSYYVGTAGNVSAETIKRYIERTEHIKGRR